MAPLNILSAVFIIYAFLKKKKNTFYGNQQFATNAAT